MWVAIVLVVVPRSAKLSCLIRLQVASLPPCVDLRERRSRLALLTLLDRLPRPFDRLAGPVHVTGSAIVTGIRGTILHRHRRLGTWLQPGGHLEPCEAPWEAALREASEETGLPLSHQLAGPRLAHVDVHPAAAGHIHLDLRYLLRAPDREPCPPPGESQEVRWFSWPEALGVADAGLVGALRALMSMPSCWQAGIRGRFPVMTPSAFVDRLRRRGQRE